MGSISTVDMSTNWMISHGSLQTSITFESSDSPPTVDSQISPLILHPPSPDSSPCEIKLCFMEKHEIRQVYVRSTARVYEIYYATTLQSDNEYLCTVRCGIAEKDGEFLQASGVEVVNQQYMKDYAGKPTDGKVTAEAKVCTSEDDWVEVKTPDSSLVGNRDSCLQNHTIGTEGRSTEDLYEATAQITDADPCMSLTIRFLSLQNKGSVCIDEIYIFGDPIDSSDMETPAVPMGNQTSSFMAMLVPTLLQLSKSSISQKQDKDVFDSQRKENEVEIASRTSDFADAKKESDQEKRMSADDVQLEVTDKSIAEPSHSQPLTHENISRENHNISTTNNDASAARIEKSLEQLLDRVSRIEKICLKFEEHMVIPINSMEMRLQRLEQQVEILAKSSQQSGVVAPCTRITAPSFVCSESNSSSFYDDGSEYRHCGASELEKNDLPCDKSCTRIRAPSFTCSESNSSSLHNDGNECRPYGASERDKKDTPCNRLSDLSDDMPCPSKTSHVVPNLVISAPEFSCEEDEEESDIVESSKGSSQAMQKQVLSIDDALAAALSGFLSTSRVLPPDNGTSEVIASEPTSKIVNKNNEFSQCARSASVISHDSTLEGNCNDRPSKYTQILAVAAPDFTDEDYEFDNPNVIIASSVAGPELASAEDGNNEKASPSTGSQIPGGSIDLNGSKSMHTAGLGVASEPYAEKEKFLHESVHLNETSGADAQESVCTLHDDATACPSDQDDKVAETNVRDSTSEPQLSSHNLENAAESEEHDASKGSHVDVMQNVFENVKPSKLDFDIPILDVKFTGSKDGDTKLSLEVLFDGMAEVNVEAPSADKNADDGITTEGITSAFMEELPERSAGNGNPLLDYGTYAADTFSNLEGHSNPNVSSNQEVFIGLL